MNTRIWKSATQSLVLALAYFITGWLGLLLPAFGSHITLIWLPAGIAVAALLRYGYGCWPGVALGAMAVNFAVTVSLPAALAIAVGNTLGPLLAAWALRRVNFHPAFDRKRDIMLLGGAAAAGMLISASVGVIALSSFGVVPNGRMAAWLIWWAGDTMSVIAAAPLVFAFTGKEVRAILARRWEFAIWLGAMVLATWGVFVVNEGSQDAPWPLAFVLLPMVAWAALRYGPAGTSLAVIVISVGAACGAAMRHGPLYRVEPFESVTVLWIYMATSALLGWLITALQTARIQAVSIQQMFEGALSDLSLGVLLGGLDRRITYANHGFTRLTGYTEAELLGRSCAILQGPDTDPIIAGNLKIALHGNGSFEGEILNYRKDGTPFWNALLISTVCDEQGKKTGFLGIQRDITERKRLEQERELYFKFFLISTEPMCIADPFGCFKHVNSAFTHLTGFSETELVTKPFLDFVLPEDRERTREEVKLQVAVRPSLCFENRYVCKDGSVILLSWTANFDKQDGVTYATARDITKLREAELALKQSEDRLRMIIDLEPECVKLLSPEGALLEMNPAGLAMIEATSFEQVRGQLIGNLIVPEDRAAFAAMHKRVLQGEAGHCEFAILGLKGTRRWMETHAVPYRNTRREVTGSLGITRDITERKEAAAELQRSFETLQLFINTVPAYISFVDTEERYGMVNSRCEDYFGRPASQIVGQRMCDVQTAAAYEEMQPHVRAALAGHSVRYESHPTRTDGKSCWFDVHYVPRHGDTGAIKGFFVMVFDITQNKNAEIEREKLDRKVQEAQKLESLGVLAGGIAHDFNNLLCGILGFASIAQMELPPGSPIQAYLDQITKSSLRAADLCKQMLAYSGRGRFVVHKLDLNQLIEQTTQMLQISISKKAVLRFRLEKDLPPVEVDATQIRQVIMNLVINASEAIDSGSGVISLSTGLTRVDRDYLAGTLMEPNLPEGEYVFLEVSDTGCGMSAETQARIFDPFFTTKFTGRGLGLAAVIGIVRGHKGTIKVYSEPGRGTTFKLLVPAARGASETLAMVPSVAEVWRAAGTVLVIDDEEAVRTTLARMVRTLGMDPVLAVDGREGVEIFRTNPDRFALVLLDLTMPRMDGEQTFAELRRLRPGVKVVLMSGFNAQEATGRFTGKGLAGFLQKPFAVGDLRALMQSVLG